MEQGLRISHATAGLLSTLIVLCMGLFAPIAVTIGRKVGLRWAIAGAVMLIAFCGFARAEADAAAAIVVLTVPIGVGTAVAGSLMPLVVSESWPTRPVLATAVYTAGMSLGAATSAGLAIPVAHALGDWRDSLAVFSVVSVGSAIAWFLLSRGQVSGRFSNRYQRSRFPVRSGSAWFLVALLGLVEVTFYGINAWLPSSFAERGWSQSSAGALLTVVNAVTVPVSLYLASRGDRMGSRRVWLTLGVGVQLIAVLGAILLVSEGWLWATLLGVANGILFPSMMLLPLDMAERPADVAGMAGMMLGGGFTLAASAPFLLGLLRDMAGSFTLAMWTVFAVTGFILLLVLLNPNVRLRRDPRSVSSGT